MPQLTECSCTNILLFIYHKHGPYDVARTDRTPYTNERCRPKLLHYSVLFFYAVLVTMDMFVYKFFCHVTPVKHTSGRYSKHPSFTSKRLLHAIYNLFSMRRKIRLVDILMFQR